VEVVEADEPVRDVNMFYYVALSEVEVELSWRGGEGGIQKGWSDVDGLKVRLGAGKWRDQCWSWRDMHDGLKAHARQQLIKKSGSILKRVLLGVRSTSKSSQGTSPAMDRDVLGRKVDQKDALGRVAIDEDDDVTPTSKDRGTAIEVVDDFDDLMSTLGMPGL